MANYDWENKYFWNTDVKGNIKDGKLTIPSGKTGIADLACIGLEELREVEIPEGVTFIGSAAFGYCHNLEKVTFPNSLREIYGCAFQDCPNLKSVEIPVGCKCDAFAFDRGIKDGRLGYLVDIIERQPEKETEKAAEQAKAPVKTAEQSDKPTKSLSERLAEKMEEKSRANKSDKVAFNEKAVVRIPESNIRALPGQPGRSYASIGLNSEHGTCGSIYFSDKSLKMPRSDHNVRLLYLKPDREYNIAFSNPETNQREYHKMTGKEISDGNKAYLKERGLLKEAARPLPSVADNMQAPQSDVQFE